MEDHKNVYRLEAYELLGELEISLLELEKFPDNKELVGRVFRAMHTIKGSGAMFGFDDIVSFTHELETVYDLIRNGKLLVSNEIVGLTLAACDHIRALLDASTTNNKVDLEKGEKITLSLKKLLPIDKSFNTKLPFQETSAENQVIHNTQKLFSTFKITFKPPRDILLNGTNPLNLLNELSDLGECSVTAHLDNIPALDAINPEECYVYWSIIIKTIKDKNDLADVFIFVEDISEITIEPFTESDEAIDLKLCNMPRQQTIDSEQSLDVQTDIASEPLFQSKQSDNKSGSNNGNSKGNLESSSVRVPSEKLDTLVDLVGEFVTMQARLAQLALRHSHSDFILLSEQVERLTAELRDNVMELRMLPIGSMFGKYRRLVRDLSVDLGKDIELLTIGEETELDKNVIERLNDPLMHLIRNSIDHGIESPEERLKSGKSGKGNVTLEALHSGANVLIIISDDGKGLDKSAILKKAREKGLVKGDVDLSENEVFNMIFQPGFSTSQVVSNVSGRGVGMDVVKKAIDALGGTISMESKQGQGTKITLVIPLTLAIIEGLLVKIDDAHYVFPLSIVEECVELNQEHIIKEHGRHTANVRGKLVPYLRLREFFDIYGERPKVEQIVITNINSQKFGFVVDHVIGGHQTVLKSLGKYYKNIEGISGATILGDGSVALILDLIKLEKEAIHQFDLSGRMV